MSAPAGRHGAPATPVIEAEGVERRYAGRTVLRIERLTILPGEIVAVLGPNGAGKSTLFRLLLRLERPDAGVIRFQGEPVAEDPTRLRRGTAAVFQRPHLFAGTVASNVEFPLRARGESAAAARSAALSALAVLRVEELAARRVDTLSGGEAQRVALARAIISRPALLLLDEPMGGLDAAAARRFRDELEHVLRASAAASLLITHDAADAFALADRVVVLEAGRIVQSGPPAELLAAPATPFVAAFGGAELLLDGIVQEAADGVLDVRLASGAVLHAAIPAAYVTRVAVGARVHVAYRPEDVTLAEPGGTRSSERNRVSLHVAALTPAAGLTRVRLNGSVQLVALVTHASAAALGLAPGRTIEARLKASALRVFPAD